MRNLTLFTCSLCRMHFIVPSKLLDKTEGLKCPVCQEPVSVGYGDNCSCSICQDPPTYGYSSLQWEYEDDYKYDDGGWPEPPTLDPCGLDAPWTEQKVPRYAKDKACYWPQGLILGPSCQISVIPVVLIIPIRFEGFTDFVA